MVIAVSDRKGITRVLRHLGMVGQLGLGLVGPGVCGTLLGVWICRTFAVGSWLIALLLLLGIAGGIISTLRTLYAYREITRKEDESDAKD